jgi:alkanesulfonate monooxygenase SsuD/methylene tetrahydromethanopterin reductase-like flavin-dependent oxidoreductase (luciferase family)
VLAPMWQAWAAGDRKAALAAIPDALVDELIVHGSAAECRTKVQAYADAGVTVPVMALLPTPSPNPGIIAELGLSS